MKIHLGVYDVPYVGQRDIDPRYNAELGDATTGEVARWLEDKYGVIEGFVRLHEADISRAVSEALNASLEELMLGKPMGSDMFGSGFQELESIFRTQYLDLKETEAASLSGIVPTRAALQGVSKRFKRRRGPPRPSFIDTGLYEAAFHIWTD